MWSLLSFRNHAWVSFQGFAEGYNDAHNLQKEQGIDDAICIDKKWKSIVFPHIIELSAKVVARAFWIGELENELRHIGKLDYCFKRDEDLDECMQMIEEERRCTVYPHRAADCTTECKERGNNNYYDQDYNNSNNVCNCGHL